MQNKPVFPKMNDIQIDCKPLFDAYSRSFKRYICEMSFTTLFIWQDYLRPKFTFINDNLCVYINPLKEKPYFLEPLGNKKIIHTLKTCIEFAGRISRASSEYAHALNTSCYEITPLRNNFDYVYLTEELINLKGRKYDGKRNHIKQFISKYTNYTFEPIDKRFKKQAMDIFETWFKHKKDNSKPSEATSDLASEIERLSLEKIFDYFDELEIKASGIFINGTLKGYVVGNELNKKMSLGQFMYADPEISHIYTMLYWNACKYLFKDYQYINMEDDLGLSGLRKSKLSYYPVKLEEKFDIKLL